MRKTKNWEVTYDVFKLDGDKEVLETSVSSSIQAMNADTAIKKATLKEKRIFRNAKAVLVVTVKE